VRDRAAIGGRVKRTVTRGSNALKAAPGSPADKAGRLGCSIDAVHSWQRGDRMPSDEMLGKIQDSLGIPRAWWLERLGPASEAPESAAAPAAAVAAGTATPTAVADRADSLLADVDAAREAAASTHDPGERIRLLERAASMVKTLAAIRGSLQSERQVLDNPHMRRVCERVMRALEPFPEAAKAVRDAFAPEAEA
jgi:transcriptional regulator with XRE-family HTH domain